MQILVTDAILATCQKPVSMQTTFPVDNVTKATISASRRHPFDPHLHSVSVLSTAAFGSVASYFASGTKAPR